MFKALSNLVVVTVIIFLLTGAANAVFSGEVINKSNIISVGNSDLVIKTDSGSTWLESITGTSTENIYPGWSLSQNIYLKNNSTSNIGLLVYPKVEVNSYSHGSILENFYIEIRNPLKNTTTGTHPLKQWLDNDSIYLDPILKQNEEFGPLQITMTVPLNADNEIKQPAVKFNLIFHARQTINF